MGIVWEAYHKGLPLLGVPGITLDIFSGTMLFGGEFYLQMQEIHT